VDRVGRKKKNLFIINELQKRGKKSKNRNSFNLMWDTIVYTVGYEG